MEDDLRRDYVTGVYNSVYLNEVFRPRAERAALDGKPVGVVMVRVNEYWQLREQESDSAANCCLNMAAGILQLAVGPDHDKAVLARLNDGFFAIVTIGTPAARMAQGLVFCISRITSQDSVPFLIDKPAYFFIIEE